MSPAGIATVGVFATVPYPFFLAYLNRNIFETAIPFLSAEPSSRPGSRHTSGLRPASGAEPTRPANPGEAFYGANVYDCGRPSVYSLNGLNRSKRSIGYQWTVQPQNKRMNGRLRSINRRFIPSSGSLLSEQILERLRYLLELIVQFRFKIGKPLGVVRRFFVQTHPEFCDLLGHLLSPFVKSSIYLVLD